MSKSKNAPALFELYGKAREANPVEVSDGADFRNRTPVAESASAFRATLSSLARSIGGLGRSEPPPVQPREEAPPGYVTADTGRLELTLHWWIVWVAAASLLLLLVVAFVTGQWLGHQGGMADGRKLEREAIQRTAMDEIELARRSKPVGGLFAGIGAGTPITRTTSNDSATPFAGAASNARTTPDSRTSPVRAELTAVRPPMTASGSSASAPRQETTLRRTASSRPQSADELPWVKGSSYIIVQHFSAGLRDDAEEVQAFLAERGVSTEIVKDGRGGYRLITTDGFDYKNTKQKALCKKLQDRVHKLGRAYHKVSNGRYKLQGYVATLTRDKW